MKRQLDDYYSKFYTKESDRFHILSQDGNAKAKQLAAWKEQVAQVWDSIEITKVEEESTEKRGIVTGTPYRVTYRVDEKGLDDAVGLELVTTYMDSDNNQQLYSVVPFKVVKREGNVFTFQLDNVMENVGSFKQACRMYPKNPLLPHRMDFCYVRWFN